jgi:hypothetical protein
MLRISVMHPASARRTAARPLVWSCLLAVASPGCAVEECQIEDAVWIVVPAEDECPSIAQAQAKVDAENHGKNETVVGLSEETRHPAGTMCWYRMELDPPCVEEQRASLISKGFPEAAKVACDGDTWLYGVQSAGGADECAATIMPKTPVLPFVGADDYPARNECRYETSITDVCADIGTVPGGGLK